MTYKNCSEEQIKFFEMLKQYPAIAKFWDIDKREVNLDLLMAEIHYMPDDLSALTKFFMTIWLGEDEDPFFIEFTQLIKELDKNEINIITNWMNDPFFP